jgi:ribosomal protein S18 acetylase RimI-like enzyme
VAAGAGRLCARRTEVDHITPKALGGIDAYSNWQLLHGHYHDEATATGRATAWAAGIATKQANNAAPRSCHYYACRRGATLVDSPLVTIRPADAADFEAIARLNAEVQQLHADGLPHLFKPATDNAFTRAVYDGMQAQPRAHVYLALERAESVGYVYAEVLERPETWFRYAHKVVYVHHIAVSRIHRRRGYGEWLVPQVVDLARSQGIRQLELDTWWFNANARDFFKRLGFAELNLRMGRNL